MKDENKNFTETEAAKILGVSQITLKRIRQNKKISYYRIGKAKIFYGRQHIDEYIEKCERKVN